MYPSHTNHKPYHIPICDSIQTIMAAAQLKADAAGKKLVVTGCLAQRYGSELAGMCGGWVGGVVVCVGDRWGDWLCVCEKYHVPRQRNIYLCVYMCGILARNQVCSRNVIHCKPLACICLYTQHPPAYNPPTPPPKHLPQHPPCNTNHLSHTAELPEVDMVMGFEHYESLPATLRGVMGMEPQVDPNTYQQRARVQVGEATVGFRAEWDRHRLTPSHYAYLRVAEGCNHACTFCAIPGFRYVGRIPGGIT